ncbi:MAG: S-layer protein domain-containing protein [Candidatus Methanoperedens sp.]|nr:S-layer protein domain-containing protein [Candidatus Methanoperedens sp.]
MVINKYVKEIVFVLLTISAVFIAMAAAPDISISVTSPSNGSTINGTFVFTAQVSDSVENIVSVEFSYKNGSIPWTPFYNNNTPLLNGTPHTLNAPLDTTGLANGDYQLNVTVVDNSTTDNTTSDTSTFFTVANVLSDTTPPASVTGLSLIGNGTTWLLINWTNPSDPDFDHVSIYKNGTFVYNTTTNTTNSYNLTGLNSGSTYEIIVKTVDTTGNVNQTGANLTATTDPNTQTGSNVQTTLQNSTVTFTSVTGAGNTLEIPDTSGHTLPSAYYTAVGSYLNISTSATVTAPITVSVKYNTVLPSGYSDSDVRLYHWNYSTNQWDNVTTTYNPSTDMVTGQVSSLSPFVPGVPARPAIIKDSPTGLNYETIGVQQAIFKAYSDQTSNITWYVDNVLVLDNGSIASGTKATYTNISPVTGSHNVTVTATNITTGLGNSTYWNWTVRSRSYETGNRIWDASKEMNLTYTWNPMSFYAFYYDVDNNVGNESLQIQLTSRTDRSLPENTITYTTKPDNVSFQYKPWGSYNVIGFMAEKYFAAYTTGSTGITSTPISTIGSKQLHKILMDDNTQRAIYAGSTLTLSEGYVLKIKDVDITGGKIVLLSLLKDGNEVDTTATPAGSTYVYSKKVGVVSNVPIIAVHIETVFSGREANAAFLKGIFQISEGFTSINTGNRYGIMEITSASDTGITMVNKASLSLSPASLNDLMGDMKIQVADNSSILRFAPTIKKSGTYEVRGTISQATDPATIDWNPLNFEGFYYDIDEDVGSEKLTLTRAGRTIDEKALVYTTLPQPVSFKYKNFGTYKVIGFMANKYFAGYIGSTTGLSTTSISTIASKQLHKVLADDNTQRAVYAGSTLTLSEGYVLKVKDVDITGGKIVLVSLLKDGNEVDTTAISAGNTYVYTKRVGVVSDLPIIAAHIETVFSGKEANAAFIKGIFQISEAITPVTTSDQYGIMKVTEVSDNKIEMKNTGTVTLSQNSIIDVMGNIKFHVADSNDIRFYPFILVNGSIAAANQLSISVPSNPSVKDTITIAITAGSSPADGAAITFDDTSIGTTNSTGKLDYTLTRSGIHNITATKLGYEKAVKTIQVAEWVDNRLSIDIPAIIDQGIQVSIKVQSNGTAIAGASITLDNSVIGATDIKGILNYSFTVSGTHNLGASKDKYVSVVREISIRMPFSEYRALDINISPNVVFANVQTFITSNITNAGTKADTKQVELIVNSTVVDNRSVSLAPGEIKEVNFTYKEAQPGNYTIEILGQKGILEVKQEPINYYVIGGVVTVIGLIAIYLLTAKGILGNLLGKFGKKGVEEVKSIEEVKK